MANLLIHSMAEFADIILGGLQLARAKTIVEVGSEYGTMTRRLLTHAESEGGAVITIDPAPSSIAKQLLDQSAVATLIEDLSLNALTTVTGDAYLIDGDHNYYTVLNESELIWRQMRAVNKPFLVFYHDVGWPCARRDLYYDPDRIPAEFRHPHVWHKGVTLYNQGVIDGGFRGNGQWACATKEGGARNGILTAIEDFVEGKEEHLCWARVPAVFGLGILFDKHAEWASALTQFLLPYHENSLLAQLERNRLECYLAVLAAQDGSREAVA
jgi:Methyltransferase domain